MNAEAQPAYTPGNDAGRGASRGRGTSGAGRDERQGQAEGRESSGLAEQLGLNSDKLLEFFLRFFATKEDLSKLETKLMGEINLLARRLDKLDNRMERLEKRIELLVRVLLWAVGVLTAVGVPLAVDAIRNWFVA